MTAQSDTRVRSIYSVSGNPLTASSAVFYFTPELLLHSAELWRLEALALAHNKPPDDATTVYVEQRELYIDEVFSDVAQLSNNARRLDEAATAEVQRACRLRSEMSVSFECFSATRLTSSCRIDERLLALGFEPSECVSSVELGSDTDIAVIRQPRRHPQPWDVVQDMP